MQAVEKGQTAHARHAHIAENHTGEVLWQDRQAVFGTAVHLHFEPGQRQPLLHRVTNAGFVVDHNH